MRPVRLATGIQLSGHNTETSRYSVSVLWGEAQFTGGGSVNGLQVENEHRESVTTTKTATSSMKPSSNQAVHRIFSILQQGTGLGYASWGVIKRNSIVYAEHTPISDQIYRSKGTT